MNKYSTDNENVKVKRMSDWKTVKLSDICILEKGQQIDTSLLDDSKPYRYINGGIKESGYYDDFNTSGESVLISEGGASCGYINYVNENFWCGCHCYRLHDIKVFPKYLFHALKANQQRIMALRTGSAMPNIQKSTIQKFELKIHDDSSTQQKVSIMLDKCNELIEKHKQTLEKYDVLIKSRFIEMFGDPVINPKGWEVKKLSEVCAKITDGTHNSPENYTSGAFKYITAKNIKESGFDFSNITYVTKEVHNAIYARCNPEKDDVLYIKDGATTGIAMVNTLEEPFSMLSSVALLKQNRNVINGFFLSYQLNNPSKYKSIRENMGGAAITRLTIQKICLIDLIVPPIELQNNFASFVQQIDGIKSAVQKSLEKAETLYKSLKQQYFG